MNKLKLKIQKQQLALALSYAKQIEDCDNKIEAGRHVNYFKSVREEAISKYADAIADILQSSIEIEADFDRKHAKSLSDDLMKNLDNITSEFAEANGIKFK